MREALLSLTVELKAGNITLSGNDLWATPDGGLMYWWLSRMRPQCQHIESMMRDHLVELEKSAIAGNDERTGQVGPEAGE